MILAVFLEAPTNPSDPMPQNFTEIWLGSPGMGKRAGSMDRWVTSSVMPTVKWLCPSRARCWKTAYMSAGVVSLEDRPYRPPMTRISWKSTSFRAAVTSR